MKQRLTSYLVFEEGVAQGFADCLQRGQLEDLGHLPRYVAAVEGKEKRAATELVQENVEQMQSFVVLVLEWLCNRNSYVFSFQRFEDDFVQKLLFEGVPTLGYKLVQQPELSFCELSEPPQSAFEPLAFETLKEERVVHFGSVLEQTFQEHASQRAIGLDFVNAAQQSNILNNRFYVLRLLQDPDLRRQEVTSLMHSTQALLSLCTLRLTMLNPNTP